MKRVVSDRVRGLKLYADQEKRIAELQEMADRQRSTMPMRGLGVAEMMREAMDLYLYLYLGQMTDGGQPSP